MFENEMTTMTTTETAEVATEVETTKKHRGRAAKPAMTLTDVLNKFDADEVKAFSAEWGKDKLKAILVKVDGVPTALVPADAGKGFNMQDYNDTKSMLSIIDKAYPVSVKLI
mgnify:CR=1 FL=1